MRLCKVIYQFTALDFLKIINELAGSKIQVIRITVTQLSLTPHRTIFSEHAADGKLTNQKLLGVFFIFWSTFVLESPLPASITGMRNESTQTKCL